MSHAWLRVDRGPFGSDDNEMIAANILCDVAGYKLPFPELFTNQGIDLDDPYLAAAGADLAIEIKPDGLHKIVAQDLRLRGFGPNAAAGAGADAAAAAGASSSGASSSTAVIQAAYPVPPPASQPAHLVLTVHLPPPPSNPSAGCHPSATPFSCRWRFPFRNPTATGRATPSRRPFRLEPIAASTSSSTH